ncbi:MAG: CpsD/CapB family tyrosine-protein kinase [Sulfitobacter sp.]|nr:CpsD/CapB family tyrosine-protein kinase [Sulfitobacter sp.]
MKDMFHSDDPSDTDWDAVAGTPLRGMRHSIRPRGAALQKADDATDFRAPTVEAAGDLAGPTKATCVDDAWETLPFAEPAARTKKSSSIPVVDLDRDAATVRAFDLLRTRLRQTTLENGWINIGITAPTYGCGNTFTAVNLALSLSRLAGSRTVLMDLNLRRPAIAQALETQSPGSMKDFLSGEVPMEQHLVRISDTLALGLNSEADENSSETLQDNATWRTLNRMQDMLEPQLIIYDLPPMLTNDDVSGFLPQLDGVLLISDGTQTMGRDLLECERMLDGQVPLLGVVLNRARASSVQSYS